MDCYVVSFVTRDEVLGIGPRCAMRVVLQPYVRNSLLENHSTTPVGFGVPFDMITPVERFSHCLVLPQFARTCGAMNEGSRPLHFIFKLRHGH